MNTLVTGAAGFIGYHVAEHLLSEGHSVVGVDNLNAYYDPRLKRARLARLMRHNRFEAVRLDLAGRRATEALFESRKFDVVIHMAAQAGVRHSIDHPHIFVESNISAFLNVLEGCRRTRVRHLIYASSSSVYGDTRTPCLEANRCDSPLSLYAATKRSNELMAHSYTHLFELPTTGLRFFTVYGPWGRPDMAPYRFAHAIDTGKRIYIYNYGRARRDFTYVDDAVEAVLRLTVSEPSGCRLFNVGNACPVELMQFLHTLEAAMGKRARRHFLPAQKGDVAATHADVEELFRAIEYRPSTPLSVGVARFVAWYESQNRSQHAAAARSL